MHGFSIRQSGVAQFSLIMLARPVACATEPQV
jgi:hypothetical protein